MLPAYLFNNISITHVSYILYIHSFICTWICLHLVFSSAQTLDQADHGKGQLHRTYQGHDVGRTWKKHLHLRNLVRKKKTFQVAAPTHQNMYTYILEKKSLCSVVMAYLIPRENNSDLTSGRFHDGTEMHIMCLRVRLNVTWILRNCFHNIHPLTGQRRLKQLGPTRTF